MARKSLISPLAAVLAALGIAPTWAASAPISSAVTAPAAVVAALAVGFQGAAAAPPPFVLRPGANGIGFYQSPAARPAQAPAQGRVTAAAPRGRARDWSTGRASSIAKPWMRPR